MDLFADGRIVHLILGLMAIEIGILRYLRARFGIGPRPQDVLATLAAGAAVLLALREALTGGPPLWIGGFLLLAFVAHVVDLATRKPGK